MSSAQTPPSDAALPWNQAQEGASSWVSTESSLQGPGQPGFKAKSRRCLGRADLPPPGTGAPTHLSLLLLAVTALWPELDKDRGREEFFSSGQSKGEK